MSTVRPICPFCYADFTGVPQLCSGPFSDRDHPTAVLPIVVEFGADGTLVDGEEARLERERDTYRAGR